MEILESFEDGAIFEKFENYMVERSVKQESRKTLD